MGVDLNDKPRIDGEQSNPVAWLAHVLKDATGNSQRSGSYLNLLCASRGIPFVLFSGLALDLVELGLVSGVGNTSSFMLCVGVNIILAGREWYHLAASC